MSTLKVNMEIGKFVELHIQEGLYGGTEVASTAGTSAVNVTEKAREEGKHVFAFVTFQQLVGSIETNGKLFERVTSERINLSPRTYVNGQLFATPDQIDVEKYPHIAERLRDGDWPQAILTIGGWFPFDSSKGDSNISI